MVRCQHSPSQWASPWTDLFDQCCVATTFAHTLYSYSSQVVISKGLAPDQVWRGAEAVLQQLFSAAESDWSIQLFGFRHLAHSEQRHGCGWESDRQSVCQPSFWLRRQCKPPSYVPPSLNIYPSVANKSAETGFYIQDDWKVNSKLTLNLGLRYQWSTPYDERHNRLEFSNFTADSGVNINLANVPGNAPAGTLSAQAMMQGVANLPTTEELLGTTEFATSSRRSVPTYTQRPWAETGFCLSDRLEDGGARRGGHIFRNEPRYKFSISRHRVP